VTASAAIGLRAHSGWAALVAVEGTRKEIEVLARRRIEIADPSIPGSRQPYHEAEGLAIEKAARLLERCERGAGRLARKALKETLRDLGKEGRAPRVCGLLLASGRALPELEAVLASHALIHAADGEHFRGALARASEDLHLTVFRVREKEIAEKASSALGIPVPRLRARVHALGKAVGPPWTQDQKLATLAAWLALCESGNVRR
jgi:hypothetical protein